jgi:hypothetical protein
VLDGGWIDRPGCRCFNLYQPPLVVPGNADEAGPWLDHLYKVYPDGAAHIILWLAHRVQRRHEKVNHALVLGGSQGIGKDTLLEPVKAAIGPWNFRDVTPAQTLGRFNGFTKAVILRVSEARDLGDSDRYAFYDHMKIYTAAPPDVIRVDEKNLREYPVWNVCGVIITTNHKSDGIFLPSDDRRHFVAWSALDKDDFPLGYWARIFAWYENGGKGHVAAYLRSVDISMFDPKAPPPKTTAWHDIVDSSRAPEDAEFADALDQCGRPAVIALAEIAGQYIPAEFKDYLQDKKNSRRIPHRLEACGYVRVRNREAQDGLWKINGRRQVIYGKADMTVQEQLAAVRLKYHS